MFRQARSQPQVGSHYTQPKPRVQKLRMPLESIYKKVCAGSLPTSLHRAFPNTHGFGPFAMTHVIGSFVKSHQHLPPSPKMPTSAVPTYHVSKTSGPKTRWRYNWAETFQAFWSSHPTMKRLPAHLSKRRHLRRIGDRMIPPR